MEKTKDIQSLIAAAVLGRELAPEDRQRLEEWLAASEANRELFERIKSMRTTREIMRLQAGRYGERMAERFAVSLRGRRSRFHSYLRWAGGVAAAAVVLAWGVRQLRSGEEPMAVEPAVVAQEIAPGSGKAVLTLANGRQIDILKTEEESDSRVLVDTKGRRVEPEQTAEETWQTLSVPAGGEFFYRLSDSTSVWLNSASELRFPTNFCGAERHVYLKGEAFFDVTHDDSQPFVVGVPAGDITVYGTRFAVSDYREEPLSAVLVEGSIGFTANDGKSVRLAPAERLVYEDDRLRVEQVDTTLYTAWVHRLFIFKDQPLGEIMTTLSRWYDFDVTFVDRELRDICLSGRLRRYDDVRILLYSYEESAGIRFNIQGRNIIVSRK